MPCSYLTNKDTIDEEQNPNIFLKLAVGAGSVLLMG